MNAKQVAENEQAHATIADMQMRGHYKEEVINRLLYALKAAETARVAAEEALLLNKAEQLQLVASAYSTGAQHAARDARRSPSRSVERDHPHT